MPQEYERLNKLSHHKKNERENRAREIAEEIARIMKRDYNVKKVYLYGSLAYGDFTGTSDIALFLVGFAGNYWRALSRAQAMAGNIEISLACEEDCFPELVREIYEKGVEI